MNTTELLASIKRGIAVPANQNRFTDVDMLALADEETQTKLLPVLLSMRQEYLVRAATVPLVALQRAYPVPARAIGRTVRQVTLLQGANRFLQPYIQPEDSNRYLNVQTTGTSSGFFFEGDNIIIVPTPNSATASLEVKYEIQCSSLTDVANAAVITAINTAGNFITVSAVPSTIIVGRVCDFIQGAFGNAILEIDFTVTNISGLNIFFAALPTSIAVGDWLSPATTTPVINLPREMHQVLAQAVECRLLEGLGDFEGLQASGQKLTEKTQAMLTLLSPRQKGAQQKIVNHNGFLNRGYNRSRNRWN